MVERDDIQPDETIGNAYKVLFDKYRLGSQYEWLASFAKQKDLSLEICIEKTPGNKKRGCRKTIREEGALVERGEGVTRTYAIDPEKASAEVAVVFENLRFPADLWNMEKTVELDCIHQMNMDDLIPLTWFCNRPVLGMPCGRCNPCIDATSEGMGYRIPFMGRVLGHLRHFTIDCVRSVWGRLFR